MERGQELFAWREKFVTTCKEFDLNVAEVCIRFGNSPPTINSVALGSSKAERVAKNVAAVTAEIPGEFWDAIKERGLVDATYPYV